MLYEMRRWFFTFVAVRNNYTGELAFTFYYSLPGDYGCDRLLGFATGKDFG